MKKRNYKADDATFSANAYTVKGYRGIAWYILGWETRPDEDTEWSGYGQRTGNVVAVMVGDDRHFVFDPDEVTPLSRSSYCGECGQMGCHGDGNNDEESRPTPWDNWPSPENRGGSPNVRGAQ